MGNRTYLSLSSRERFQRKTGRQSAHSHAPNKKQGLCNVILGISTSGRVVKRDNTGSLLGGVTEDLVKFILKNTGEPSEYVSLSGKQILGCQGCLRCASDNICKQKDDWAEI
jgi:hypothetical protein